MNCKLGDLAYILVGVNAGHTCTVLRSILTGEDLGLGLGPYLFDEKSDAAAWWVSGVNLSWGAEIVCVRGYFDTDLQPLRDTDGADETLAWKVERSPIKVIA